MKPVILLCLMMGLVFVSCKDKQNISIEQDEQYESSKVTLKNLEENTPAKYIEVQIKHKKNLVGRTVIKGTVYNHAKVVTYKDLELKMHFYSKTGALLEEDIETVYETVAPGGSKQFKSKYFAPKSTDSVAVSVLSAKW